MEYGELLEQKDGGRESICVFRCETEELERLGSAGRMPGPREIGAGRGKSKKTPWTFGGAGG